MIKKTGFIIFSLALLLALIILTPEKKQEELPVYADMETNLLFPQKNVTVITVDLKDQSMNLTDPEVFRLLMGLENHLISMDGVSRTESLFNAQVIKTEEDDIIVNSVIPKEEAARTDDFLLSLPNIIPAYPELQPYVNKSMDVLLFFVYFTNNMPSADIENQLKKLQQEYKGKLAFHYTGRAPIMAETEKLLTKDIAIFFPLLFLLVMLVFLSFRNPKAIALSWGLILLALIVSFNFIKFLGMEDSPLILLIPVFGMGLLSDYIIHYFYHYFYEPDCNNGLSVKRRLLFPLSLTALSSLTGFLSLVFLDGTGHLQLGTLISCSIILTVAGVFLWLPYLNFKKPKKKLLPHYREGQIKVFTFISRHRIPVYIFLSVLSLWGLLQIPRLKIEPYPIEQLPVRNTVKRADTLINDTFFGTVPYFIEIDTGENNRILTKDAILTMDRIQTTLESGSSVGYTYSLLSVLKRMNYYFQGSEDSLLNDPDFDDIFPMLIEQYLLYYSSSVDPLEYESLLDASYRYFSIKGMVYYKNVDNLDDFRHTIDEVRISLPPGWDMTVHGMIHDLEKEQDKLRKNWLFSFFLGSFLIFLTVLIFYRKIRLALLSLIPAIFSMIFSFGMIASASLSIDAFSIIFVAIITGLVIDYSIHTLTAIESLEKNIPLEEAYGFILSYSGIPIFLSFLTSLFSFSVLFLSSFRGARNLGLLLVTSLAMSYFLSLFLLPLLALPHKHNNIQEVYDS